MRSFNRRAQLMLFVSALVSWSLPALAQAPERLSNNDVKALLAAIDDGRDKFEGNLDGAFKGSTLRGPTGETKVSGVLQDYQDSTKKLKERFTADYSASAEAATVLKQATAIDAYMQKSPNTMKGRSEWDSHVTNIRRLAGVYATTFPLPDGASARRMNDKETAAAAEAVANAAGRFKSELGKEKALPKPGLDAARKDIDLLSQQANAVKSRTSGGQPATGEMRQLLEQAAKLQAFVDAHQIPTALPSWQSVQAALAKVQQAFGLTK